MSATTKQTAKIHYDEIDPNDLVIGDNVRDNADQGPEFEQLVSSIKETGHIYQPINVVIGADGAYVVTDGQRRTLAARRLGLATVPVRVQQPIAATDKQRTAERVTEQLATDNAKGLTVAQKAKGVQELLLADVTPAKVAKVTGYGKEFVNAATKVVKSTKALAALDEAQLTMEQALALIEFEDDDQAIEYLKDAATEGEFDHRASELRIRKAAEADYTERTKPYADKGFTILPFDFRQWQSDLDIVHAERLYASLDDSDDRDVSIETIESNPQLWAVHLSEQECYIDTRTDAVVDEDLIEKEQGHDCYGLHQARLRSMHRHLQGTRKAGHQIRRRRHHRKARSPRLRPSPGIPAGTRRRRRRGEPLVRIPARPHQSPRRGRIGTQTDGHHLRNDRQPHPRRRRPADPLQHRNR
ncbi:transcriptional regulator [Mycobacteroides abscessus subsp. abscessus]|nr:transcriptional regulator [Mycobacteroides abscessus subsp. abscessus]